MAREKKRRLVRPKMAFFFLGIKSGLRALPLPILMQQAQNPYMLAIAAVKPPAALPIFYNGGNVGVQVLEANGVRYPGLRLLKPVLESRPPPKPPVLKPMPRKLIAKKKQAPGGSSNKKKQPLKSLAELCDDLMEKLAQTQENNVVEIAEKKKQALAKSKAKKKVLAAKPFFDLLPSGTCLNLLYMAFCARLTLGRGRRRPAPRGHAGALHVPPVPRHQRPPLPRLRARLHRGAAGTFFLSGVCLLILLLCSTGLARRQGVGALLRLRPGPERPVGARPLQGRHPPQAGAARGVQGRRQPPLVQPPAVRLVGPRARQVPRAAHEGLGRPVRVALLPQVLLDRGRGRPPPPPRGHPVPARRVRHHRGRVHGRAGRHAPPRRARPRRLHVQGQPPLQPPVPRPLRRAELLLCDALRPRPLRAQDRVGPPAVAGRVLVAPRDLQPVAPGRAPVHEGAPPGLRGRPHRLDQGRARP